MKKSKIEISNEKIGNVLAIAALCILAVMALFFRESTNLLMFLCLIVIFGMVSGHYIRDRERRSMCSAYCKATVIQIITEGNAIWLVLKYNLNGWPFECKVRYYEKQYPSIGQDVGLYYDPEQPEQCVLQIYKTHQHGWSNRTKKNYISGIASAIALGVLICGIGVSLLAVKAVKMADYTGTAQGVVVSYMEQYNFHTGTTPGTYEYMPVVQYEVDGATYTGKSVQLQVEKTYDIGESVKVKYNPSNPQTIVIVGDNTTTIGAVLMIGFGAMVFLWAGYGIQRKKKVWEEIAEAQSGIRFV